MLPGPEYVIGTEHACHCPQQSEGVDVGVVHTKGVKRVTRSASRTKVTPGPGLFANLFLATDRHGGRRAPIGQEILSKPICQTPITALDPTSRSSQLIGKSRPPETYHRQWTLPSKSMSRTTRRHFR